MAVNPSSIVKAATTQIMDEGQKQKAQGQAANTFQMQQALSQPAASPAAGAAGIKTQSQQMAGQMTAAQGQTANQAQANTNQQVLGAAQTALKNATVNQQQNLESQALANDDEIAAMQREGKLRQNSAELASQKRMEDKEIEANQYMSKMGMQYDNQLSFLTRKQREDLASLGNLTKQQLFDSRMQFQGDEATRKFTNARQLADYAVASAESDQQLEQRLREMEQGYKMEEIVLDAAITKINQQLELEFQRAEKQKDQALALELAQKKAALEAKLRKKKAQAAGVSAIITGAFTVGGAVVGSIIPGAGTVAGAAVGSAVGGAVAGQVQ